MTCHEMDDLIEALAAGDEPHTAATRAHLDGCVRCQAALARAQQIERLLAGRPAHAAPPRFAEMIAAHVRRERWESEQALDRWFNVMVAACALLAAGGLWLLANISGVTAIGADAGRLVREGAGLAAARMAVDLPMYVAATGILISTIAIWLWAERTS
jgi:hypothetical protein